MAKKTHEKIVAMVPAKLGSTRLAMKNIACINGKPLIYYAIKAAKKSGAFDRVVINAEDAIFSKIAKRYRADFYKRPEELVNPKTKTDSVVYDFLMKNHADIIAWINPIAPLQSPGEVRDIVRYFIQNKLDTLMTVKNEQVHCMYKDRPINFRINEVFTQTQDIVPVQVFVYSVMMWRARIFKETFEKKGYALLCGKVGLYPVSKLSSVIIKKEEDLMLADYMMQVLKRHERYTVRYDRLARKSG